MYGDVVKDTATQPQVKAQKNNDLVHAKKAHTPCTASNVAPKPRSSDRVQTCYEHARCCAGALQVTRGETPALTSTQTYTDERRLFFLNRKSCQHTKQAATQDAAREVVCMRSASRIHPGLALLDLTSKADHLSRRNVYVMLCHQQASG